jgi:hypothetical protein
MADLGNVGEGGSTVEFTIDCESAEPDNVDSLQGHYASPYSISGV